MLTATQRKTFQLKEYFTKDWIKAWRKDPSLGPSQSSMEVRDQLADLHADALKTFDNELDYEEALDILWKSYQNR